MQNATKGTRKVWFDGGWHQTRVWSRLDLPEGAVIEAPAVLEQPDATIKSRSFSKQPYWHIERARIDNTDETKIGTKKLRPNLAK